VVALVAIVVVAEVLEVDLKILVPILLRGITRRPRQLAFIARRILALVITFIRAMAFLRLPAKPLLQALLMFQQALAHNTLLVASEIQ
jgi:hypothetical protein